MGKNTLSNEASAGLTFEMIVSQTLAVVKTSWSASLTSEVDVASKDGGA